MYCKGLTKQWLMEAGIVDIKRINNQWLIYRLWYDGKSKSKTLKTLTINKAIRKHKYTETKSYDIIMFSIRGKGHYTIPLSRVIYAWFKEDIPDGYVIDHIDNDPFNNNLDNLKMTTIETNLKKRFVDNPGCYVNQWAAIKDYDSIK